MRLHWELCLESSSKYDCLRSSFDFLFVDFEVGVLMKFSKTMMITARTVNAANAMKAVSTLVSPRPVASTSKQSVLGRGFHLAHMRLICPLSCIFAMLQKIEYTAINANLLCP